MPRKKQPEIVETQADATVIDMKAENALHDAVMSLEHARTPLVMELTQRALTLRARGLSEAEIAASEKVEVSTLALWLSSPHRSPTPDEARAMLETQVKPLAMENLMHMLRAGDKPSTRQVIKDSGVMRPAKHGPAETRILVGVGLSPVGSDPLSVAVAISVKA